MISDYFGQRGDGSSADYWINQSLERDASLHHAYKRLHWDEFRHRDPSRASFVPSGSGNCPEGCNVCVRAWNAEYWRLVPRGEPEPPYPQPYRGRA